MLEDGSNGTTKEQITKLVTDRALTKYESNSNLSLANVLFVRDTFKDNIKSAYSSLLKTNYNAEVITDSFASSENVNKPSNESQNQEAVKDDKNVIEEVAKTHELIVTCEEHNLSGGFGSAVAEVLAELPSHARLIKVGMNDEYSTLVGDQKYLRHQYGMSGEKIAERILFDVK